VIRALTRRAFLWVAPQFLVALQGLAARPRGPLIWVASRKGGKVYIFGVGNSPDRHWLTTFIESAVNQSVEVWGEAPNGPVDISYEFMNRLGTRTQGSLFDDLSGQQAQRILDLAKKLGFPREKLEKMKPWYAARVLTGVYLAKEGAPIETTVTPDVAVINLAKKDGKAVKSEYATWEEFIRFFDTMPQSAQVQYLCYELDLAEKGSASYKAGDDAWEHGDSSYFLKGVVDMRRRYPDLYRALLVERNASWCKRIDKFLSQSGTYFIVVGMNHMLGPDSIEGQLRQEGIAVRAVQTREASLKE
jgi:uncharacterized protein